MTRPPAKRRLIRSLTRLVVGGAELGIDTLFQRLDRWERELAEKKAASANPPPPDRNPAAPLLLPPGQAVINAQTELLPTPQGTLDPSQVDLVRYALIGLLFESGEIARENLSLAGKVQRLAGQLARPVLRPVRAVWNNRWVSAATYPLERAIAIHYDALVERGETEVRRWIEIGRREEAHSRELAGLALDQTVEEYIQYLTQNPEVQELVQTQSTGLANEVIEEVRERTVSADTFLEGLARSLLRRVPRRALPQPPVEVRMSAASIHPAKTGGGGGRPK